MKPVLKKVGNDINPKELAGLLERDGAAIVEGALSQQQITSLNSDVDEVIAATAPGLRHATSNFFLNFMVEIRFAWMDWRLNQKRFRM